MKAAFETIQTAFHLYTHDMPDEDAIKHLAPAGVQHFDVIWTTAHIGRSDRSENFIQLGDALSLLITSRELTSPGFQKVDTPEWVHQVVQWPERFASMSDIHTIVNFMDIEICNGTDPSGRRWIKADFGTCRILVREPNFRVEDPELEWELKAALKHYEQAH